MYKYSVIMVMKIYSMAVMCCDKMISRFQITLEKIYPYLTKVIIVIFDARMS